MWKDGKFSITEWLLNQTNKLTKPSDLANNNSKNASITRSTQTARFILEEINNDKRKIKTGKVAEIDKIHPKFTKHNGTRAWLLQFCQCGIYFKEKSIFRLSS